MPSSFYRLVTYLVSEKDSLTVLKFALLRIMLERNHVKFILFLKIFYSQEKFLHSHLEGSNLHMILHVCACIVPFEYHAQSLSKHVF